MNNKQFIEKLKEIESQPTVYYSVAGGDWAKWNGRSWNFDCVILIKAILWGWNGNKNHAHGGANYGSNGVYDDGTEQLIARCHNISTDFNNITPGEVLWMPGHVGVYVGEGKVIEATAGWEGKVLYSNVSTNGARTRNGYQIYNWQKHGKLPYIDYVEINDKIDNTPIANEHKLGEVVTINGVYVSSTSSEKLNPAITRGTITKIIEGARNPYLLDNGNIGWVNDDCIVGEDTTKYLSNPGYAGYSIVDGLNGIGVDSSYGYRARLAQANGIEGYVGSASQNTLMLEMLKKGTLKSV